MTDFFSKESIKGRNVFCVSLSGGLDSSTTLYKIAKEYAKSGDHLIIVTFDYGQVNAVERVCADKVVQTLVPYFEKNNIQYKRVYSSIKTYLTQHETKETRSNLVYYYPSRNLIMSSILANIVESYISKEGIQNTRPFISMGIHKHTTYEEYWDIKPEFVLAVQNVLNLNPVKITFLAPYVNATKKDIYDDAIRLKLDPKQTWSCYDPVHAADGVHSCGECEACIERQKLCGTSDVFVSSEDIRKWQETQ